MSSNNKQSPQSRTVDEPRSYESGEVNTWDSVGGTDVNVPGHWADVPDAVLPVEMEDGDILVESDMRTDPTEGTQGSYTILHTDEECPECGVVGHIRSSVHTLAGIGRDYCDVCDWEDMR